MWSFMNKRTHRGLRTWVLYILQDAPKNGAEIMDSMEAMSRGWWRPSPGSVYPLLESLATEGVIRKQGDGRYALTEGGKEEIDWPKSFRNTEPRSFDEVLVQMQGYVSYLEDLSKSDSSKIRNNSKKIGGMADRLKRLEEA
jgi:DNA-binding PadR family transcriptional regulator